MKIINWIDAHPDDHLRIICYTPAPDVLDDRGCPICGGEGTSTIVFDSTTGECDLAPDLLLQDVTTVNEGDDGVAELEYMPEEYWY